MTKKNGLAASGRRRSVTIGDERVPFDVSSSRGRGVADPCPRRSASAAVTPAKAHCGAGRRGRPERPAAAALRQPEIGPRQFAHRPGRQLCGRLAVPEVRPADGDHPGIRQLAAGARFRRLGGLDQPVAAVGQAHRRSRHRGSAARRRRSSLLDEPDSEARGDRHHRARRRRQDQRSATANGAR